ncbi:hypothetical protein VTK73DRAFT_8852 [Phialemonium thermophilum]|uniref:Uncharacterized protein n=1 Tax=Phialemonium thermophilum TaxID=223376 RepID=A0ABR3XMY2_9PEZI
MLVAPFLEQHPSVAQPHLVRFDARLHHPTVYGGPPSPAVESLWMDLAVNFTPVAIPEIPGKKAGLSGSVLMARNDKSGNRELAYLATVEVFHQLHCLDLLRKAAYPNFGYYSQLGEPMFNDNELYQLGPHIGHCVDILRQSLTCKPDYALIGYSYVEGLDYPVPNFPAVKHNCHNFSALQKWTEERAVRELRLEDLVDRKDERVVVLKEVP